MRFIFTLCVVIFAPLASAQSLTTETARNFVNTLPEVNRYAENLDPQVRDMAFEENMLPMIGEAFTPYTAAMAFMNENHTDVYQDMENLVSEFGFASAEEWAGIGDRVMSAYLASQISSSDMQQMEQITPEMLEQMPAEMRPQLERMLGLAEAIRNTPAADIEIVRPLSAELEQLMNVENF